MRVFLLTIFLILSGFSVFAAGKTDSLLEQLKTEISRKKIYDAQKQRRIKEIKSSLLSASGKDLSQEFAIFNKLYEEYKVYNFDSAYVCTQKLLAISKLKKDLPGQYESRIKLGFILISAGMFKEGFDCLNQINTRFLNDSDKIEYYSLKSRAYANLAEYNTDKYFSADYLKSSGRCLDSAIVLCKPDSYNGLVLLANRQIINGDTSSPSPYLNRLLYHYPLSTHQRAMAACGLSCFYKGASNKETYIKLLAISAINDIRSSTKETLAIFQLGQQLYNDGNVKDAYTYLQQAMDDAQFYGARLRKIRIGAVLPVIAAQKIVIAENEKNTFLVFFLSITVVAILISFVSFIVFIQLRRLKAKEKIIEEKNVQLERINEKLNENGRIKEEYIGYFVNITAGYILKLEKLKRSIERKLMVRKYDDISLSLNEINIKKEREALFCTFDETFLKIFPSFISAFNSLLKKEDQVCPKENELLNTDLRIFALMRLGISDCETIASILEYSANTIYVYKMRIKAKSILPGDQFEQEIMAIKAVSIDAAVSYRKSA
jgi:tetratricopeptide (TPR) repeat protein